MIDFVALQLVLYNWASSVLTDPVIWYYPNAPRPNVDYFTLLLHNMVPKGQDWVGQPDSSAVSQVVGNREFALTIQGYGGLSTNVFTDLEGLASSLQLPSVQYTLRQSGVATIRQGGIINITKLINSDYEIRASLTVYFRVAQAQTDTNGLISTVDGDYVYDNAGTAITGTYTVPNP